MMSLEVIRQVNEDIAQQAAEKGLVPYVPFNVEEVDSYPPFRFPNLGYLEPEGWEKTETSWFVDKTGGGRDYEPALTWSQFKRRMRQYISQHPGYGFAITEEGECQVYISAFMPVAA